MSYLSDYNKFHLIGAGGVSMSAIAKYLMRIGKTVSGSDRVFGDAMVELSELGCDVYGGTLPDRIPSDACVVYTSAVGDDNVELIAARKNNIPTVERKCFLAEIESGYATRIAVAGTHGKTTVTAMIASILSSAGMAFTAHIGGYPIGGDNLIFAGNDVFLTEACEYRRSFLQLNPTHAVVTNVEPDHPDTYKDVSELYAAFDTFLAKDSVKERFINDKCAYRHTLTYSDYQMHTFAGEHSYVTAESIMKNDDGTCNFRIKVAGGGDFRVALRVPGRVNVDNALAATAVALSLGVSYDAIADGLQSFAGVERRFQLKGRLNGAPVYVDYAHHPTEIKAAVATARDLAKNRLLTVFQPHTYSRTAMLFDGFVTAFRGSDRLYITSSYSAREKAGAGRTAYDLYRGIVGSEMFCSYYQTLLPLAKALQSEVRRGDLVLILGAGDVDTLADLIVD